MYQKIAQDLDKLKNPKHAQALQRFFKTGKGEYGEGDIFLGIKMAKQREVAKKYFKDTTLTDVQKLLNSKIHEHRMVALLILVEKYKKLSHQIGRDSSPRPASAGLAQNDIFSFYLKNTKNINNWDLVDLSAANIIGNYLFQTPFRGVDDLPKGSKKRKILYKLAKSKNLWQRRIAIIATLEFIKNNHFQDTIKISETLLNDKHDLIHKAVGWMLREMGKRDEKVLIKFLDKHTGQMPRTMLRYSIERLEKKKREYYLNKK